MAKDAPFEFSPTPLKKLFGGTTNLKVPIGGHVNVKFIPVSPKSYAAGIIDQGPDLGFLDGLIHSGHIEWHKGSPPKMPFTKAEKTPPPFPEGKKKPRTNYPF